MQYLWILFFVLLAPSIYADNVSISDDLYLQACGGNPQNYKRQPKIINEILREVPNKVISHKASIYGRPFITHSTSSIQIDNQRLTAELSNFRDLKVTKDGKTLYETKVSGATSIYELIHNGKVYAWGVGWHKQCGEDYENTEFTVLRVVFPVLENGKTVIQDKLLSGAYITGYESELKNATFPVIMESEDIYSSGATSCYYCLPKIYKYEISKGLIEQKSANQLKSLNVQINDVNPLIYVSWLSQYGLKKEVFSFVGDNFELIYKHKLNPNKNWRKSLSWSKDSFAEQHEQCMQEIYAYENGSESSISAMGWACFPVFQYLKYFEDLSRYEE